MRAKECDKASHAKRRVRKKPGRELVGAKAPRNESYLHSLSSHLRIHNTPGKYSRDWGYRREPKKSLRELTLEVEPRETGTNNKQTGEHMT